MPEAGETGARAFAGNRADRALPEALRGTVRLRAGRLALRPALVPPPPRGRWLAPGLVSEVEANLQRGEQSLLFLNRRGFAPLTLCRHCGHRFQCPNCTAWMVEHRLMHRLACHHCGHVMPPPKACPECGEEDSPVACGPGVERIPDEVAALS